MVGREDADTDAARRAIQEQAANAIEAKLSKKGSFQLGGVSSCVSTARQKHLTWQSNGDGEYDEEGNYHPKPPPELEEEEEEQASSGSAKRARSS